MLFASHPVVQKQSHVKLSTMSFKHHQIGSESRVSLVYTLLHCRIVFAIFASVFLLTCIRYPLANFEGRLWVFLVTSGKDAIVRNPYFTLMRFQEVPDDLTRVVSHECASITSNVRFMKGQRHPGALRGVPK
jgi:hypothetical protein